MLAERLKKLAREQFVGIDVFPHPLDLGPPVGRPIQYRIGGPDIQTVRGLMQQFAGVVATNAHIGGIVYDWNEPGKVLQINVDQDKRAPARRHLAGHRHPAQQRGRRLGHHPGAG